MGSKDRVGHNAKRKPVRSPAEKRQARRDERQALKSSKRKRRVATAHPHDVIR